MRQYRRGLSSIFAFALCQQQPEAVREPQVGGHGEAACRIDVATEAEINALRQKLAVLGGSVKLAMKQLTE